MLSEAVTEGRKKKGYINSADLVLIALASAFFPRMMVLLKAPNVVFFLHFAVVPLAFGISLLKSRSRDPQQLTVSKQVLFALLLLLTIGFASAFFNDVGVINVVLQFLLFNEPIMLLLAIICIPMSVPSFLRFRGYVLGFGFFNLIFALIQKFILKWDTCNCAPGGWTGPDAIMGVFVNQGAGCIVSASVSMVLAVYFFLAMKQYPLWLRSVVICATFLQIIVADAKQVVVVAGVAWALLALFSMKDLRKGIISVIAVIIAFQVFWWAIYRFEFLSAFAGWVRPDLYGPDGEATKMKLFGIRTVLEHLASPLNWLLGLGPGHTIDRLGGWMLQQYAAWLEPLGATRSTIGDQVWADVAASWLANGSTMFSPFFGWAAIWGDLGWVGVVAYLYMYSLIWRYLCKNNLSQFLVLFIFVNGWVQAGLQEPGFMLFVACLLGICWQEVRLKPKLRTTQKMEDLAIFNCQLPIVRDRSVSAQRNSTSINRKLAVESDKI